MAQNLAPAEKNSTDISAASATFCISAFHIFSGIIHLLQTSGLENRTTLFMESMLCTNRKARNDTRTSLAEQRTFRRIIFATNCNNQQHRMTIRSNAVRFSWNQSQEYESLKLLCVMDTKLIKNYQLLIIVPSQSW